VVTCAVTPTASGGDHDAARPSPATFPALAAHLNAHFVASTSTRSSRRRTVARSCTSAPGATISRSAATSTTSGSRRRIHTNTAATTHAIATTIASLRGPLIPEPSSLIAASSRAQYQQP